MGFRADPEFCAPIIDLVYRHKVPWKEAEKLYDTGATTILNGWRFVYKLPVCTKPDAEEYLDKLIEANGCSTTLEYLRLIVKKDEERFQSLYKQGKTWRVKKIDGEWYRITEKNGQEIKEKM